MKILSVPGLTMTWQMTWHVACRAGSRSWQQHAVITRSVLLQLLQKLCAVTSWDSERLA
jgi:hypothetical protein